jgi:hypothetical protein
MNRSIGRRMAIGLAVCLGLSVSVHADLRHDLPGSRCPGELGQDEARLLRELEAGGYYDHGDPSRETGSWLVYLAFHVVRNDAGAGGIAQAQLDQGVLELQEYFAPHGICFTVVHQDTLDNSDYNLLSSQEEADELRGINNRPDAIDVYFVNDYLDYCGQSSFTWNPAQGIIMLGSCMGLPPATTFPHEVGHYFDLLHTHETALGDECPDGSNCTVAGDLLCDTPADPELNEASVPSWCTYQGTRQINCNGANRGYDPDTHNMMSYTRDVCRTGFTPQQVSRMIATLTGPRWGQVGFNSPDFDFFTPSGWTNALVPRNTTGATPSSATVTAFLAGNSNSTWLNQAMRQARLESHNPGVTGRIYLDNVYIWNYSYGGGNWSGQQYYNNFGPITVRGGRHALHSHVDHPDDVCESNEGDNLRYTQYVWSPTILSPGTSVLRDAPPDPMTGNYAFPNCDGLQFNAAGWWSAVALQPTGTFTDYDLALYDDYAGSTQGFGTPLVDSSYGNGVPDWVLVNHHHADAGYGGNWQVGVTTAIPSVLPYRLEHRQARSLSKTDGTRICGTIAANRVMDLFEVYFSADDIADSWTVTLSSAADTDLDLYLYPEDEAFLGRVDYLLSSQTESTPTEVLNLAANSTLPSAGWYAFVIAKDHGTELDESAAWEVRFINNAGKLGIAPPQPIRMAVFQDGNPWGNTEWTDQLDARQIDHDVLPTANLATTVLDDYHAVIIPSPGGLGAHNNILANRTRLTEYNLRGGVVVQGTATLLPSSNFLAVGGVLAEWQSCSTADPSTHALMGGVGDSAPGSPAVSHVLTAPDGGWMTLAESNCGSGQAVVLLDENDGMLVYGSPMEGALDDFDLSLGESIENIVAWAAKRARQTVRRITVPNGGPVPIVLNYSKPALTGCTFTNSESASWLTVSPLAASFALFDPSMPVTYTINPGSLVAGSYHAQVSVNHNLYNAPETVHAYLTVSTRKPAAPLDLTLVPLDFSPGNATVQASWTPVTHDTDGLPITVESYRLYYDDEWPMLDPAGITVTATDLTLYYGSVGMLQQGFLRVTATDSNGQLVADSHPGQPLPAGVRAGSAILHGSASRISSVP